jgi:TM2 domain-containing membrane protein YozV
MPLDARMVAAIRSPGLAAVLSFFWCGLGQIYNGQIGKGIAMLVIYGISWVMIGLIVGLISTPILWIWGMVDAYRTAERLNRQAISGVS